MTFGSTGLKIENTYVVSALWKNYWTAYTGRVSEQYGVRNMPSFTLHLLGNITANYKSTCMDFAAIYF
jgi:hypothetical protein